MGFITEKDLNKLMTLKPGIARKYRQNNKFNRNNLNYNISINDDQMILFDDKINEPSMQNILQKAKKNIQLKKSEIKTLKKQPNNIRTNQVKIIHRTTLKPPELRFNSKPIQPAKPIIYKKHQI
eukprot:UN02870